MSATAFADDENLQRILAAIRAETEPERVYLFGSRARGEQDDESDYDLLVLSDEPKPEREIELGVRTRLCASGIPFDLFVSSTAEFEQWRDVANTLPCVVQATGVVVYGRERARRS